jgi:dTDP-4-amino-4,6-dideoxygalactose transaminase
MHMQRIDTVTSIPLVDLKAQYDSIKGDIDAAMASVISQTAFVGGSFVQQFEQQFARYCGVKHCVAVANGTDALFIALKALGIGPGDEVITVANTFIATAEAITMAGAQVVFVDIDPDTCLIDAARIEEKITPRTRAIIPVHLYGQPADMQAIRAIADRHGLTIVGDAAQAHGARDQGVPIARLADITCFSFYPGKNLGAYGDGGALVTDNDAWTAAARMFANHGRTATNDHDVEGVNSRLDGLQAAVLSVKLRHLEQWTERRRHVAYRYNEALEGLNLVTPKERPDVRAVYHLYVVRVAASRRDALRQHLAEAGISTGIHYPVALPYLNAYKALGHTERDFPEALKVSREILSLPIYAELTDDRIQYIADRIATAAL